MHKNNIYEDGIENFSISHVIFTNVFLLVYYALGFLILYPISINGIPIFSLLYVTITIIFMYFVLRKCACTHCYYYGKWCHVGWSKLTAVLFKENSGNKALAKPLLLFTWGF
ncbi:hypothetical protein ACFLTD_05700, partial [Elusimicrobiota bacterium]